MSSNDKNKNMLCFSFFFLTHLKKSGKKYALVSTTYLGLGYWSFIYLYIYTHTHAYLFLFCNRTCFLQQCESFLCLLQRQDEGRLRGVETESTFIIALARKVVIDAGGGRSRSLFLLCVQGPAHGRGSSTWSPIEDRDQTPHHRLDSAQKSQKQNRHHGSNWENATMTAGAVLLFLKEAALK